MGMTMSGKSTEEKGERIFIFIFCGLEKNIYKSKQMTKLTLNNREEIYKGHCAGTVLYSEKNRRSSRYGYVDIAGENFT